MLKIALSAYGETFASRGNYNNFLGVPINLASIGLDVEYAIIEIGMNHAGEIEPLSKMTKPDIAIVLNVDAVHLEFFNSVEDIALAKSEIFYGLNNKGIAIINKDNKYYPIVKSNAKILRQIR